MLEIRIKKLTFLIILLSLSFQGITQAQDQTPAFTGAAATLSSYKALYALNSGDEKRISTTLRNINNALNDPRLKGKLQIELVVFGDGVSTFLKSGPFEESLKELQKKGVILAQCENTLKQRKIEKSSLFPFISFVPSANGEIIIRHYEGWAVLYP